MAMRRVARVCAQLEASPTAGGTTTLKSEIEQILAALGPAPLSPLSRKIFYKLSHEGPVLAERAPTALPELVARISALSPPPFLPQDGEKMTNFVERSMSLEAPAVEDGASDGPLQVVKSLLLYAAGAMDEAHNIAAITQVSKRYKGSGTRRDACYAHGMIHRQEGKNRNEEHDPARPGGEIGWHSSAMFFNAVENHPLYPKVLEVAQQLAANAKRSGFSGKRVASAVAEMGAKWDPERFVKMLQDVEEGVASSAEKTEFCTKVMNAEWRILLDHVLAQAKIEVPATTAA